MKLSVLPKDIEKIILSYKYQIDHYEKYKNVLCDIKKNISIKYLVPLFDFDSGYLCKTIDYKNKQKFCSVICSCCGRQIHKTTDEYEPENNNDIDEIKDELKFIHDQIITDTEHNDCVEIIDYTSKKYDSVCERIEDTLYESLDVLNEIGEDEVFEILFELGEEDLEDFMLEEYSEEEQ